MLLIVLLFVWMRRSGGAGGLAAFGRSRARRVEPSDQTVDFDDVAGIDEAKDELIEVVDFLKRPGQVPPLGGRIPRGVLLDRPARHRQDAARARGGGRGAGAVLLDLGLRSSWRCSSASAPRGSAICSHQAKKAAPAIVFIDELDAIGRSRAGASAASAAATTSASRR